MREALLSNLTEKHHIIRAERFDNISAALLHTKKQHYSNFLFNFHHKYLLPRKDSQLLGNVAWGLSPSLVGLAQKTISRTHVPRVRSSLCYIWWQRWGSFLPWKIL